MGVKIKLTDGSEVYSDVTLGAIRANLAGNAVSGFIFLPDLIVRIDNIASVEKDRKNRIGGMPPVLDKKEAPFYEGCDSRDVVYEGDGVTASLIHCTHPHNPDTREGNCREDICPQRPPRRDEKAGGQR